MKHGFFLFVIIALIGLSGCKARKSTVRNEKVETISQTENRRTDTASVVLETKFHSEETQQIHETTERETVHVDTLGRIRTIIRESVRKETGSGRTYRGQGSAISLSGKTDSTTVMKSSNVAVDEKTDIKTDSRPVQGAEWAWVSIGIGIFGIIFLIIRDRLN